MGAMPMMGGLQMTSQLEEAVRLKMLSEIRTSGGSWVECGVAEKYQKGVVIYLHWKYLEEAAHLKRRPQDSERQNQVASLRLRN